MSHTRSAGADPATGDSSTSTQPSSAAKPIARLVAVSKTFAETPALQGISLNLPSGIVGLLGPNGAGKSTLMRLLLGLDHADSGSVELLGWPLPEASVQARAEIGFMPEDDSLFPGLNGIEQVVHAARLCGIGKTDAFARAHEMLDLVGLSDARYRPAAGFSLGMRQRLRFAMALVHGPRLVLLDEPTSGLDPAGRAEMLQLIGEVGAAGTSVLLSTHVLGDVEEVCDHVVLLTRGKLGFVGPTSRFRAGSRPSSAGSTATKSTDGAQPAATAAAQAAQATPARYAVDVVGDSAVLVARLVGQSVAVERDGDRLVIVLPAGDTAIFWQAAADAGVGVRAFQPMREAMADAFVRHLHLDDPTRQSGRSATRGGQS